METISLLQHQIQVKDHEGDFIVEEDSQIILGLKLYVSNTCIQVIVMHWGHHTHTQINLLAAALAFLRRADERHLKLKRKEGKDNGPRLESISNKYRSKQWSKW